MAEYHCDDYHTTAFILFLVFVLGMVFCRLNNMEMLRWCKKKMGMYIFMCTWFGYELLYNLQSILFSNLAIAKARQGVIIIRMVGEWKNN